jgi:hypothetical protein
MRPAPSAQPASSVPALKRLLRRSGPNKSLASWDASDCCRSPARLPSLLHTVGSVVREQIELSADGISRGL